MKDLYADGVSKESDEIEERNLFIKNAKKVQNSDGIDEFTLKRLGKLIDAAKTEIQNLLYNK